MCDIKDMQTNLSCMGYLSIIVQQLDYVIFHCY